MSRYQVSLASLLLLLSGSPLLADVAPPSPEIARHPVLAADRQPAFATTIAAGLLIAAAVTTAGVVVGRFQPRRGINWAAGVIAGLTLLGAAGYAWSEHRRAAREQDELTARAEREWAQWEVERAERARKWVNRERLMYPLDIPTPVENPVPRANALPEVTEK